MLKAFLFAAVLATITPGTQDLYSGTRKLSTHPDLPACVAAAKARGVSANYTCRTRTGVVVAVTVDPPPPPPAQINCVVSDVAVTSEWSACNNGVQTRSTSWSRTVVTEPANGGAACPKLPDPVSESRSCTIDPPPVDPPPAGNLVYASPPSADMSKLAAGETLVLRDGTYTSINFKAGTPAAWLTLRAEHDGAALVPALNIGAGNWYLTVEGVKAVGSGSSVTGGFVTLKRVAFKGGPPSGNGVSLQLGTNDRTPGCSNITVEDSWVYGLGGRYKVLVYNCDTVKLTRVVARHDGGWNPSKGDPQGGFAIYDSKNVTAENIACLDSVQGLPGFESCIYLVSNGTTPTKQANITINGAIIIDSPNNGLGAEGTGAAATYTVNDLLVVNSAGGGINTNNSAHVVNATRVTCSVKGVCFGKWASGGAIKVSGCKFGKGTLSSGASLTNCPGGAGADFGALFPWPYEERIKADFDAVRPAFGGRSLTGYVQGATP
jgi:hypothetical protein